MFPWSSLILSNILGVHAKLIEMVNIPKPNSVFSIVGNTNPRQEHPFWKHLGVVLTSVKWLLEPQETRFLCGKAKRWPRRNAGCGQSRAGDPGLPAGPVALRLLPR